MSVSMALADFLPTVLFLAALIVLLRSLTGHLSQGGFALFAGGGIMVFTAGFYKALWKLLYAAQICDFEKLNQCFFPLQATGFLLLGIAAVTLLCGGKKKMLAAAAPAVYSGTMLFVIAMVAGVLAFYISLAVVAAKMKKKGVCVLLVLTSILMLAMGYLSSKDFTQVYMNWLAQGINVLGQGLLLIAALVLKKAGLRDFPLKNA